MQNLTSITDFDRLYQSIYHSTALQAVSSAVPATVAPVSAVKGGLTGPEIIVGVAFVIAVAYGCYYLYNLHQQERKRMSEFY